MSLSTRMCGPVLTNVSSTALFAGTDEIERMKTVRINITKVRQAWQSNSELEALKNKIKSYIRHESLPPKVQAQIASLLTGYIDWADMDYGRPEKAKQSWTAIELYCSEEGYTLFFGLFNSIFRQKEIKDDLILVATALVEFVTIELYNLRLANIGDPRYENFQGITFRGMCISGEVAAEYRKAASNPDLSKRHFGFPLGFTSSSTSRETTEEFTKQFPDQDQMHWIIHIHGLDPKLLKRYEQRYPDSVVTSIVAMPVGQVAELREKEILLRGAFFHIIWMDSEEKDGRMIHTMQLVALNTNRDHGTELALDEGAKQEQRNFFRDMIVASRYEICASLAKSYSMEDSRHYENLARAALERIDATDHLKSDFHPELAGSWSARVATWYGDIAEVSFPPNYLNLRKNFHDASKAGNWTLVQDMIKKGYEWEISDWFNLTALDDPYTGRTLIHEMAEHGPPSLDDNKACESWNFLLDQVEHGVWKTLRTADTYQVAAEIARNRGHEELAMILEPKRSGIAIEILDSIELQLHQLLKETITENELSIDKFSMPQLCVLEEMSDASLWIPIPKIYGGFLVKLEGQSLQVEKIETRQGTIRQVKAKYCLTAVAKATGPSLTRSSLPIRSANDHSPPSPSTAI